ncbi:N-acetylneuraminate synthase family protein [Magnetovibrio sp. PR-2]|uniref:N-acetylneuraminate synthase family protein n=1 Tax=Magnetovibrio sp. PR-2 TaxID=3120356 RepID=UPI002FCE3E8A
MFFKPSFQIENKTVGTGEPSFFIAEAGVAHFGDMDMARQLLDLAVSSGADAFKIQLFDVEALISNRSKDWQDRLRPRNLTLEQAAELKQSCENQGLIFLATAHDETRIPWLEELDVPAIKIGSGERNNSSFVKRLAELGKPMIISTGMSSTSDVQNAMAACEAAGNDKLALLHCITSYPTPPSDVNLAAMDDMKTFFSGPVGYSDHTEDGLAVLMAVARGATMIEKHITILRDIPNAQDWKVSADPDTLRPLIEDIRRVETMIGHGRKEMAPCEQPALEWALKSLVAATDLPVGHVLTHEDIDAKRPGDGISPNRIDEVVGKKLARPLRADALISFEDLQ